MMARDCTTSSAWIVWGACSAVIRKSVASLIDAPRCASWSPPAAVAQLAKSAPSSLPSSGVISARRTALSFRSDFCARAPCSDFKDTLGSVLRAGRQAGGCDGVSVGHRIGGHCGGAWRAQRLLAVGLMDSGQILLECHGTLSESA
jgi:hypothetical protein